MKTKIKILIVSVVSVLIMACATGPIKLPERYNFENKLEEVNKIYQFKIKGWQSVDYQSLIIETNVNDYYLLVLQRPAPSLPFSEAIGITLTVDHVRPGFDNVIVSDSAGTESYIISKIYKFKDHKQALEIKEQIKKSKS